MDTIYDLHYKQNEEWISDLQRKAGWSDESIASYAKELREFVNAYYGNRSYESVSRMYVGAGLAQDNSRHGVTYTKRIMEP